MEGAYKKIREQAFQKTTVGSDGRSVQPVSYQTEQEPGKAAEPEKAAEPQKAPEPEKSTDAEHGVEAEPPEPKKAKAAKKAEEKPKEKPPRMTCEGCGSS